MQLSEKVAIVTGGSGALGSVVANRLSSEGARVIATTRQHQGGKPSEYPLDENVRLLQADVSSEHDVLRLYDQVLSTTSRIDIVVNTVGGFLPRKPLVDVSVEEWDSMMEINLRTAFLSTREALRRMRGQAYGRVINISAMVGLIPSPGRAPYAISKAGVSLLTEMVAQEVKGTGITVNAIAPSIITTRANRESMPGEDASKWVTPEALADLVCFLCTPSAGSITGTTVKAYGGV